MGEEAVGQDGIDGSVRPPGNLPYPASTRWTYRSRRNPVYGPTTTLGLTYELNGSALSDDYDPAETSAADLWDLYVDRYGEGRPEWGYAPGVVHIFWYVSGHTGAGADGPFEEAPFQRYPPDSLWDGGHVSEHFLTSFTWPRHAETEERLNFARLAVVDKAWNSIRADKGGFVQELTGWKPSPLQPTVDLRQLAAAAGLSRP